MKTHSTKSELKIIPLVLIAIVLVIAGHFLMKPIFHNTLWVEYSLALLPFILILLVVWAFKIAIKNEKYNNDDRTN
jgi:membrane protease YdiL (CAAX protease family)